MRKILWFFIAALMLIINSCNKQELEIVRGNEAPPDSTLSNLQKETYINRVYIALLGRKADSTEFSLAKSTLSTDFSLQNRELFIRNLQNKNEFKSNWIASQRLDLLNGVDTNDIKGEMNTILLLLQDSNNNNRFRDLLMIEYYRYDSLLRMEDHLIANKIDFIKCQLRCLNNGVYDQINMGSENFVTASFTQFFNRYPTNAELESAKKMIDGVESFLFLQSGKSKLDYLNIFFNSAPYFEGQVYYLYQKYLYRNPNPTEAYELSQWFAQSKDYPGLLSKILASYEYVSL